MVAAKALASLQPLTRRCAGTDDMSGLHAPKKTRQHSSIDKTAACSSSGNRLAEKTSHSDYKQLTRLSSPCHTTRLAESCCENHLLPQPYMLPGPLRITTPSQPLHNTFTAHTSPHPLACELAAPIGLPCCCSTALNAILCAHIRVHPAGGAVSQTTSSTSNMQDTSGHSTKETA